MLLIEQLKAIDEIESFLQLKHQLCTNSITLVRGKNRCLRGSGIKTDAMPWGMLDWEDGAFILQWIVESQGFLRAGPTLTKVKLRDTMVQPP